MFMVFPHVMHAQRADHVYNIKGVWSHLCDMTTPFLYALFYRVIHVVEI